MTGAQHPEDGGAEAELRAVLAMARLPGFGPRRIRALIEACGGAAAVLSQSPARVEARCGIAGLGALLAGIDWALVEADLAWARAAPDRHLLPLTHPNYPALLREIHDPPPLLYVQGDPRCLSAPQIAIVGSRKATAAGTRIAFDLAVDLARAGIAVTSGLALGIDAAAHRGALHAGGQTVAVFGTGLGRVYPADHLLLAREIAQRGALCAELPPAAEVRAAHFPRRNRIIAGLSLGTLVVEADLKSGSLITARAALEQGREVFAVPGSIHNPVARGCHALIKEGANLVEGVIDILVQLAPLLGASALGASAAAAARGPGEPMAAGESDPPLVGVQGAVLTAMGYDSTSVDTLVGITGLPVATITSSLLLLELYGQIQAEPGGIYLRLPPPHRAQSEGVTE